MTPHLQPAGLDRPGTTAAADRRPRQRNWPALALAVAMAAPVVSMRSASVHAQETPPAAPAQQADIAPEQGSEQQGVAAGDPFEAPAMLAAQPGTPQDALRQGVQQYRAGAYEDAVATLQAIDAATLSESERKQLNEALAKAEAGAAGRREARESFERGQASLENNRPGEAITAYKKAADHPYADDALKRKAKEQIAVAESARKGMAGEMKQTYKQAVAEYKAKDYASAREKFQMLRANGFKAGAFQKSPADYLRDINKRLPADAAPAPEAVAEAPAPVEAAPEAPVEAQPDAAAAAPAPSEPVAAQPAQPAAADPREVYQTAKRQYERKQYDEARRNFELAQQLGYRARMFEDTPAQYINRIDRRQGAAQQPLANAQEAPAEGQLEGGQQPPPNGGLQQTAADQRTRADALVDQAREAQQSQDFNRALDLYTQAAQLDPTNQRAIQGRTEMLTMTGRGGGQEGGGLLAEQERQIRAQREEIQFNFDQAINNTTRAIGANDYATAELELNRARAARNINPTIFTQQEIARFDQQLANTQVTLDRAQAEFARAEQGRQQAEAADALARANAQRALERERTVADLIRNSRTLIREGQYNDALGVLDQIITLEPTNDYATGVRPLVQDKALHQDQRRYREEFDIQYTKQLNAAEEKKIPYDDILRYPANWPDISELRDQTAAEERGEGAADQATQTLLNRALPEVRFDAVGFADVVDFLRDVTGANIFVNWRALEGAGIDRAAPVSARLRNVKFSKALETILADVGGGTVTLGYTIDEGVITISTTEDLSRNTITRVYDIRDLIINIPNFEEPPEFDINQQTQVSGGGGGGGGGGGSLFGGGGGAQDEEEITREELVEQIVQLIQETVAPESWRDAGGSVGSVRELSGQLIVTQTPENQRLLVNLLEQLRETRAIQVTIEARFLTVQRNFLEDIGFDADFTFNNPDPFDTDTEGWGPVPVDSNGLLFTANPATGVPGSIGQIAPGTQDEENPQSVGLGAFQLEGSYLDNFTVNFLIRATAASINTTLVTAPRVTLFNGQRAFVVVATQTAYVSDLEPIVGTRAVAFDPTIGIVSSGVLLDVQATVSADRKYVTLTLRPTLSRLVSLTPFVVQAEAEIEDEEDDDIIVIDDSGIAEGIVQQPIVEITQVRTTVSVPDGGTLLLGGQTLAGETEREAGAPILSKIPFIKRLFTNRSFAKDEQVLLILVKPTIIIQREQEQKQFPTLSTRLGNGG